MADFCRACTIELFGAELADLNEMARPEETEDDLIWAGLCEHCGYGWFDRHGNRYNPPPSAGITGDERVEP